MNQDTRSVDCSHKGQHAHVEFNNPERHNAMSLSMWTALSDSLNNLSNDEAIRAVVLSGAGSKAFVSGADISEFDNNRATADAATEYDRISEAADIALSEFPKPTIAKIRGYCIGGGLGLALACDIRVCADDASFAIPAGKLGLGYNYRNSCRLLRMLGQANASELFYTARRFNAEEALQMGLVNKVVPALELDSTVDELLNQITANAPMTLAAFKAAALAYSHQDNQVDDETVSAMVNACFVSEDYVEGRRAFKEKRKPDFRNR